MVKNEFDEDHEKGCIINISSVAATDGQKGQVIYAMSKGAVNGMCLPMARDLGKLGIRVNVVASGIIMTPMGKRT